MVRMEVRSTISRTPAKPVDEKITINLGYVDLGQIDLLVQEGFYANRTDLIRTAIRSHLAAHAEVVKQVVARKMLVLGIQYGSSNYFEAALLVALFGFVGSTAMAKFLLRGEVIE
jgi:multisubunit Na+/H+ antiporter MnhF subunit